VSYALVYVGRDESNPDHRYWGGPSWEPGARFPLAPGEGVVVGRATSATIRCFSNGVARHHVLVTVEGDLVTFSDLQSTDGTWKDGVRVERGTLAPGERLALAGVFLFELQRE
jgi:Inner membrane component of T3SS, cytoplasmic domain